MDALYGFPTDHGFKVTIVGDANVGKTSLLLRFVDNKFTLTSASIGSADYFKKLVTVNGNEVNLHLFDTGGCVSHIPGIVISLTYIMSRRKNKNLSLIMEQRTKARKQGNS